VACLTADDWVAFSGGRLDSDVMAATMRHLASCAACRLRYAWTEPTATTSADAPASQRRASGIRWLGRGTALGRYLILDQIGAGGMGVVYVAFDPQLDRKVALKVLRTDLGADQTRFRARMLREAKAMARLSHPHVIHVHDVGVDGERVFLAMELVDGGTLKSWLRQRKRPWREVLDVFLGAGRGLAAAHAAGLVHRDFKPENVILGVDGRARVTDFGLARAADSGEQIGDGDGDGDVNGDANANESASLDVPLTRAGTVMGTPGYMSPEQCRGEPADARSDQFGFCATLYEALYGQRAFPGLSPDEVMESVADGKLRDAPADSAVPMWLRRILLRGLRVEPAERWPSMDVLLEALARDPAQQRRRWLTVAGVAAAMLALVGVTRHFGAERMQLCRGAERHLAGLWDEARRAEVASAFSRSGKPWAARAGEETVRALDAYAAQWVAMHGDACEATRLRGEQAESVMALRMSCLDERKKDLAALTDVFANADDETAARAVQAASALPPVSMCADVQALSAVAPEPADAGLRTQIAQARTRLATARAWLGAGKYKEGLATAEAVGPVAAPLGYRALVAEQLALVGELRFKAGDYQGAERAWKDALYAAEEARLDGLKSHVAVELAKVTVDLHGFAAAHEWLRFAEATVRRTGGGEVQVDLWIEIALAYFRESRYPEAEAAARKAITLAAETLPPSHLGRAAAYRTLGDVLKYEGRYDEGLQLLEKARTLVEAKLGPEHPEVAAILRKEVDVYAMRHDGAQALALGRRVLALLSRSLPPEHLQIAQTRTNLAEALALLGRYDEAVAEERLALPTYERIFGPNSENVGVSNTNIGHALVELGRTVEARRHLLRAIAIYDKTLAEGAPDRAEPLWRLGQCELAERRPREALRPLEQALVLRARDPNAAEMLADVELTLAQALAAAGADRTRARRLAERARDQWAAAGEPKRAAAASTWLASLR
jgi:eukaryotic-like serine/threonine-protein kinase